MDSGSLPSTASEFADATPTLATKSLTVSHRTLRESNRRWDPHNDSWGWMSHRSRKRSDVSIFLSRRLAIHRVMNKSVKRKLLSNPDSASVVSFCSVQGLGQLSPCDYQNETARMRQRWLKSQYSKRHSQDARLKSDISSLTLPTIWPRSFGLSAESGWGEWRRCSQTYRCCRALVGTVQATETV